MKKILMAVIAIIMTVGTLSAQQNMYVWKTDGTYVPFSVSEVDSIGFYLPASMTVNTKGVGVFSVSETKKVTFSPGNLQYQASTDRWRFAEHQWDIVGIGYGVTNEEEYCFIGGTVKGSDNRQISDTYTGWIDLFGWGTGDAPTKSHDNMSEYANFTDWGTNWIGSDAPNTWHTLSSDEWGYLFYERPNAHNKYGAAKVNGMVGMVILPDKWTMPDGCDFEPGMVDVVTPLEEGTEEYTNFVNSGQVWNRVVLSNYYDGDKWQAMEDNGAVFLPAAGYRELTNVIYFGLVGHYWSSSFFMPSLLAYPVIFGSYLLFGNQMTHFSCTGKAVRLVSELPAPSYILTITTEGEGVVRGAGTYKENEKATLVATPEEGWQFVQWSDGNTSNPRSIKMTQNLTYTALFTEMNDIGDGDDNTEDDDTFGAFSVSATEKVIFSPGNLQFNAAEGSHLSAESPLCDGYMFPGTWRFAENQWDIIGLGYGQTDTEEGCVIGGTVQNGDNRQLSYNYDGWIDLFGFGTSGWISGAYEYNPWGASVNCNDYYPGTSPSNNLTGDCAYADWGVYNQIGDDAPGTWRTLTKDEWVYLLGSRPNAGSKYGAAKVNGVTGIVLLPNKWTLPDGCSFAPGMTMAGDWKDWSMVAVTNIYEGKQWEAMEDNGAVFLPCAGTRNGTSMRGTGTFGFYWTSTACSSEHAYGMQFISYYMNWQRTLRYTGSSVRLVRDIQKEYTLSVTTEGEGTVTGDGTYKPGDVATLTATPAQGYVFSQWSDGDTENPRKITMTQDLNLVAVFTVQGDDNDESGTFSISDTKKVIFSPGNLQYKASDKTKTWRFAQHQWDYLGQDNKYVSSSYEGWIDLFGWGTGNAPTTTSTTAEDYPSFAEWGANTIGNDAPGTWRTLTSDEWDYLLNNRPAASDKYAAAKVNNVPGIVILPDQWKLPDNCQFTAGMVNGYYDWYYVAATNVYSETQWDAMEKAGAVFLPAAGYRYYNGKEHVVTYDVGRYWSSNPSSNKYQAFNLNFTAYSIDAQNVSSRHFGSSVRLVSESK